MGLIAILKADQRVANESAATLITETTSEPTVDANVERTDAWAMDGLFDAAKPPASTSVTPAEGRRPKGGMDCSISSQMRPVSSPQAFLG